MSVQSYPRRIDICKGEGRILLRPRIDHIGGTHIVYDKYYDCKCDDVYGIGERIFEAFKFIDESPECTLWHDELNRVKPYHIGSKYKTWKSFDKNYIFMDARLYENGELYITSGTMYPPMTAPPIKLTENSSYEEVGKAVVYQLSLLEKDDNERYGDVESTGENEKPVLPQKVNENDKVALASTTHLVEDELSGDSNTYRVTFKLNDSFCQVKSHALELLQIHFYAPGYDPEYPEYELDEQNAPCFFIVAYDDIVYQAIQEYKKTGTYKGAKEYTRLSESGVFYFKAKVEYGLKLMYFYAANMCEGAWDNYGFCMTYPKSYENTDDEKRLMSVLDEVADSYNEEIIR